MSRTYRCHVPPQSRAADYDSPRANGRRTRPDPSEVGGVAICPCCRAPLVAVMGRCGPYFHCRCYETEKAACGLAGENC